VAPTPAEVRRHTVDQWDRSQRYAASPTSVACAEIDVERFVDEVGFSRALVAELGGDAVELLAHVGEVEPVGWG